YSTTRTIRTYFDEVIVDEWSYKGFVKYGVKFGLYDKKRVCNYKYKKCLEDIERSYSSLDKEILKASSLKKSFKGALRAIPGFLDTFLTFDVKMERDQLNELDALMENEAIEEYSYRATLNNHVREEKKLYSKQQLESRKRDYHLWWIFVDNVPFIWINKLTKDAKMITIRSELKQDNSDKESRDDNTDFYDSDSSTKNVSTEIKNLIMKMKNVKNDNRLFEYRIANLSEKNQADPINQVFTNNDKKFMKALWKEWEEDIKPQIKKYTQAIKIKTELIFNDNNNGTSPNVIFEAPFEDEFNYKKHYEMIWTRDIYQRFICLFNSPFNILRDFCTSELAYRDSFVNPIIPKIFDDVNDKIRFPV
ncbi:4977_t:CDS:2, partial [Dentiscutata erythropus]